MYFGAFNPNEASLIYPPGTKFVNSDDWVLYEQNQIPSGDKWVTKGKVPLVLLSTTDVITTVTNAGFLQTVSVDGVTITGDGTPANPLVATGGTGTVLTVAVATANGLAGTSDADPANPTLTLSTTVTGILKGNGTAISAAVANTDYQIPILLTTTGTSGVSTFDGTTLNIPDYSPTPFITAISDTNTVDLVITITTLSANVRHQDSATINLSDDVSGLKADFASMNVSQFTNDSGYITTPTGVALIDAFFWVGDGLNVAAPVTMSSEASMINTGAVTLSNAAVIAKVLTGYVSGAGVVAATDTILQAIEKLDGNTAALVTGVSSVNALTGAVPLTGTANRITVSAANVFNIAAAYDALWQPIDADLTSWAGVARAAGFDTFVATPSSANLLALITNETGTGLLVFNNSPTFVDDITIGTAATATGSILFKGTTSGTVTLSVADAAGTWTMKLPVDDGGVDTFLKSDGSGNTSWATPTATVADSDYGDVTVSGAGTIWTVDSFTTANEVADTTCFPVFVTAAAAASLQPKSNAALTFDSSTAQLGSTLFIGGAFKSSASNIATAGVFRMANTGKVSWRNAGNTTQYGVTLNASDIIEFDSGIVAVKSPSVFDAVTGYRVNNTAPFGKFLIGSGTDYIESTSTIPSDAGATAGKLLKSNATNYVLTTATFSDAPSTALKWMRSDGTNWITSTSTLAEGGVTARKILVSDATNWIASTETWAVPSTSGNRLISDGTNWTSGVVATSGVTTSPTSTSTSTITHNLGRIPTKISLYGIGTFTSNAAATATTFCIGTYTAASGNRCIYQPYNTAAITTTQASAVSSTFSIRLDTGANNFVTGIVQNVGATTFDIAFTETGTATAQNYMWVAE